MIGLTPRQRDALLFIERYNAEHGYGPSRREISHGLGLTSKSSSQRLIVGLEERGYIRCPDQRARAIEVIRPAPVIIAGQRYRFIPKASAA